ncbi:MAG: hypothetical protein WAW42_18285 [Candidatus Competibacteraceae bacterium]
MSGGQLLTLIIAAALASSLATLALGWLVFQWRVRPQLEAQLAALAEVLEMRVKAGAGAAGQEWLEPLRTQVRSGVEDAAIELLPQVRAELTTGFREAAMDSLPAFREEVRKGFTDALTSLNAGDLLDRTARKVVRTGSSLVGSGLNLLRSRPED